VRLGIRILSPILTLPCTPSRPHPPIHTLPSTPSHAQVRLGIRILSRALKYNPRDVDGTPLPGGGPLAKDPEWFNNDENFAYVMQQTLYLQHGIVSEIRAGRLQTTEAHLNLKGWSMRGPARMLLLAGWVLHRLGLKEKEVSPPPPPLPPPPPRPLPATAATTATTTTATTTATDTTATTTTATSTATTTTATTTATTTTLVSSLLPPPPTFGRWTSTSRSICATRSSRRPTPPNLPLSSSRR
jgi:hypothetical protein